jgi:fructokinase
VTTALLAAVELGGTKTIVAIGRDPGNIVRREQIATGTPAETLGAAASILRDERARHGQLKALGIASFGPLDLRPTSAGWGHLLATPKPGWSGTDIAAPLAEAASAPVAIDTDVNAAVLGESLWGAGRGVRDLAYVTVGTGIGGGLLLDGRLRHGLLHPEIGHLQLRRDPADAFAGICPFHGDCLEGLVSGAAIHARLGEPLDTQPPDHSLHAFLADYLGQLCATLLLVTSVERVIIGGGVVAKLRPHAAIRAAMLTRLGDYLPAELLRDERLIVSPDLADSGLAGAFALAARLAAMEEE